MLACSTRLWVLLGLAAMVPLLASAYPYGAGTCDVDAVSGPHGSAQSGNGGYQLEANPKGSGKFDISVSGNTDFKGFLLYVVDGNDERLGTFSGLPNTLQIKSDCSGENTVTHTSADSKTGLEFSWDAGKSAGNVTVRAVVVQSVRTWYRLDDLGFDLASTNSANTGSTAENADQNANKNKDRNPIIAFLEDYMFFCIVFGITTVLYIIGAILEALLKRQRAKAKSITKKVVGRF